jgi:hypothetical protein
MLAAVLLASAMVLPPLPDCIKKAEILNQDGNEHFKRNLFDSAAQKYADVSQYALFRFRKPKHDCRMAPYTHHSCDSVKSCPLWLSGVFLHDLGHECFASHATVSHMRSVCIVIC